MNKKTQVTVLFVILLVALAVRLYTAITCTAAPDFSDMARYSEAALGDELIPSSLPPGYPLFLRVIYGIFGAYNYTAVFVIQALISALTVFLIYWVAVKVSDQRTALIAAGIAAVYPNFIAYNLTTLTETIGVLFTALLLASFFVPIRDRNKAILTALVLCIGCIFRPVLVFFTPGLFFAVKKRLAFVITILIIIAPYLIVMAVSGKSSNRAARAFYKTYNAESTGDTYVKLKNTELEKANLPSGVYIKAALSFIWNNKLKTLDIIYNKAKMVTSRGWDGFVIRPIINKDVDLMYIFRYAYLPIMFFGFIGMIRLYNERNKFLAWLVISYLVLNISIAIFKVRYRLMVEPMLIIYVSMMFGGMVTSVTLPKLSRDWFKRFLDTLIGRSGPSEEPKQTSFFENYKKNWDILLVIFFLAVALRLYLAFSMDMPPSSPDLERYNRLAIEGGLTTSTPPLYPLFLRMIYSLFGAYNYKAVYAFQGILNTLVVLLMYGIVARIWNRTAGVVTAAIAAIYPGFVICSLDIQTDSLNIVLIVLLTAVAVTQLDKKYKSVVYAGLISLGVLISPILIWLVPGTFLISKKRKLFLLALMLILVPISVYHVRKHNKFVPVLDKVLYEVSLRHYRRARDGWGAVNKIYNNATGVTSKGWSFLESWPDERTKHTTYTAGYTYTMIMLLGFIGIARFYRKEHRVLVFPVLGYIILLVLFSDFRVRFRVLAEPLLIMYTAILVYQACVSLDFSRIKTAAIRMFGTKKLRARAES